MAVFKVFNDFLQRDAIFCYIIMLDQNFSTLPFHQGKRNEKQLAFLGEINDIINWPLFALDYTCFLDHDLFSLFPAIKQTFANDIDLFENQSFWSNCFALSFELIGHAFRGTHLMRG
jgi:hypothetical protein